jgi:multiple sugar transport system ATP-binding protein
MASLRLEEVTKRFGNITAIDALNLEVADGEFFCVLGPPGAGKTTMLRLIVGLERPDEGTIYIGGQLVNDVHPGQRDIAMVFQNLALYPDKTVFNNIAYPLRERRLPRDEIRSQVEAIAKTLHIEALLDRKPGKLSGGERQRVALGRAIVRRPSAYLLDEPLANLDALLRLEMRVELRRLQAELGQTLVYVTADQVEAMSMADRIAVLNRGVLQQCDEPDVVYNLPANRFVATIVGSPPTNFVLAEVTVGADGLVMNHPAFKLHANGGGHSLKDALDKDGSLPDKVLVGVRPEDVRVSPHPSDVHVIPAHVSVIESLGMEAVVDLHLGADPIKAVVPPNQRLNEGEPVWLQFDLTRIHFFDPDSGDRLYTTGPEEELECPEPESS